MSKYKIHVFYKTGNSFGSHEEDRVLEMSWSNLDKAKAALKRIQEHYRWYESVHNTYRWDSKDVPEPEWHKGIEYDFCLKFELDNGEEVQFHSFWCGYFETLLSAKIIVPLEENDLEIRF